MLRIFIFLLLIVHGLLHLNGFAGYVNPSLLKDASRTIGKAESFLWLICSVLFICWAILYLRGNSLLWIAAVPAVLLSVGLTYSFGPAARWGLYLSLLLIPFVIFLAGEWNFYRSYENDRSANARKLAPLFPNKPLAEEDIEHLPPVIQNYIRYSGAIGKIRPVTFTMKFKGRIRSKKNSKWMPFDCEQENSANPAARYFFMKASLYGLPVRGYHHYQDGRASMDIRLASLFTIQKASGPEMDHAETITYFNDLCVMAPEWLTDERIEYERVDSSIVLAAFTSGKYRVKARLVFNEEGALSNFICEDRYNAEAGKKMRWETPLYDYRVIEGRRLAHRAELIYVYPEGNFTYGEFELIGR